MTTRRSLILSFVLLATGIGLLAGYCNGTAGFDVGIPVSGTAFKLNITTNGFPAIFGLLLTVFGSLGMIATFLGAIGGEIRSLWSRPKKEKVAGATKSGDAPAV